MMAQRRGWERLRGGCGGVWQHASGWQVHHCGHPTALWPYFGVPPGGGPMLLADNGRGFGKLIYAQEAVEREVAEQADSMPLPKGGPMTNRELLTASGEMLGEVDHQRLFLLRVEGTSMPCPACRKLVNAFEAAGIDVDAYDFGHTRYDYHCPHCAAELEQVVPVIAGRALWHWQLRHSWLQEQLRKARELDQLRAKEA